MTSFFWISLVRCRAVCSAWVESFLACLVEGRLGVIEQDFLPGVDLVGLDTVLVAQVRHRQLIDKMDGCLLTRTETSSWRTHEILLVWGVILTQTTEEFPFPSGSKHHSELPIGPQTVLEKMGERPPLPTREPFPIMIVRQRSAINND
tara:strand:- start:420 stop:863 length:444 start_codon:yes stop_codon:yes gene_type:complete